MQNQTRKLYRFQELYKQKMRSVAIATATPTITIMIMIIKRNKNNVRHNRQTQKKEQVFRQKETSCSL